MPTYRFTAPDGRVLTVTGPTPPTEAELDAMFAEAAKEAAPAPQAAPEQPEPGLMDQALGAAKDVGIGALKGVGNTVFGLGKVVRDYTPIGYLSDAIQPGAFNQRPPEIVPSNTAQQVGYTAEQVGEFFLPTGAAGKVGKAAEIAKSAALTGVQGGTGTDAALSAGLTAVLPGGGVAKKASQSLRASAEKNVVQALGPTKDWAKAAADKVAPEMLDRGVRGSRQAMLDRAQSVTRTLGPRITQAYKDAAAQGGTVPGGVIRGELQLATDQLMTKTASGSRVPVVGAERVVRKLEKMDRWVESLGPDIPVDQAAQIKRIWDRIASKSGLYGQKAGATATDQADAWAIREGATSFRKLLNDFPGVEALNKEYNFWAGVRDVLKETGRRTQAHGGGLSAAIGGAAGAASGFASGEDLTDSLGRAALGGVAFRKLTQAMQSPWFRTSVSSRLKAGLADALASGRADQIERAAERILIAAPSQSN